MKPRRTDIRIVTMFGQNSETSEDPPVAVPFNLVAAPNAVTENGTTQIRLDKLPFVAGLATSVSDGSRKVKQNAVKLDGELKNDLVASVKLGSEFTLRAGIVRLPDYQRLGCSPTATFDRNSHVSKTRYVGHPAEEVRVDRNQASRELVWEHAAVGSAVPRGRIKAGGWRTPNQE